MNDVFWWIGAIFCVLGGSLVVLFLLAWLADKARSKVMDNYRAMQIINHARKHGIDIKTGKPDEKLDRLAH